MLRNACVAQVSNNSRHHEIVRDSPAVARDHNSSALDGYIIFGKSIKSRLDKVLKIVLGHEQFGFLA